MQTPPSTRSSSGNRQSLALCKIKISHVTLKCIHKVKPSSEDWPRACSSEQAAPPSPPNRLSSITAPRNKPISKQVAERPAWELITALSPTGRRQPLRTVTKNRQHLVGSSPVPSSEGRPQYNFKEHSAPRTFSAPSQGREVKKKNQFIIS